MQYKCIKSNMQEYVVFGTISNKQLVMSVGHRFKNIRLSATFIKQLFSGKKPQLHTLLVSFIPKLQL